MPLLSAGNASWKPYGIVNNNVTADTDGIKNAQHNPYLLGPVTFAFTLDELNGVVPDVTEATFYFGTEPDTITGTPIPEPGTLTLLGGGLLLILGLSRRFGFR
jgi:hypothetical protein